MYEEYFAEKKSEYLFGHQAFRVPPNHLTAVYIGHIADISPETLCRKDV